MSYWYAQPSCGTPVPAEQPDPTVEAIDKNLGKPDCGPCSGSIDVFAGNPVNVATGNKYEAVLDLSISTPGIPIEFRRHYNSQAVSDGPLGYGWTHGLNVSLHVIRTTPSQRVRIDDADGRSLYFSQLYYSTPGEIDFYGESGVRDRLTQIVSTGEYLLRRHEGNLTYRFGADGKLTQISDPHGNTLTLAYTGGLLTQVSNNSGRSLTLQYDGSRISSVTDPKGQSVSYVYTSGDLTQVTYPDSRSITYAYSSHQLTDKYDTDLNLVGHWEYTNGRVTTHYRYLDNGVPQERIDFAYNSSSTTLTRSTGTTTYATQINDGMRMITSIEGCGTTCGGTHKSFAYDSRLNLTDVTFTSEGEEYTTHYTYDNPTNWWDQVGEIVSTTEAQGWPEERVTAYGYTHRTDDPFLLTQQTETKPSVINPDQNKVVTTVYYTSGNGNGKPQSRTETGYLLIDGVPTQRTYVTGYQYNSFGQITQIDGPRTDVPDITTFEYYPNTADQGNNRAQLKAVANALSQRTELSNYDANGNVGTITDPNGVATLYTYDERNRLLTVTTGTALTRFSYDGRGSLSYIIPPEGNRIDIVYTLSDRLREITDNAGNRIVYGYDVEGNRISEDIFDTQDVLKTYLDFTYDAYNRLTRIVNPDATYTEYSYDDKGNRISFRDPRTRLTTLAYDPLDRLKTITQPLSAITDQGYDTHDNLASVVDPRENATTYQVDDFGRRNVTTSPDTGSIRSVYDPAGNLTQSVDAKGTVVNYAYDALNRPTSIQYPSDPTQNITFAYDSTSVTYGIGRLTGRTDPSGTYVFHYDSRGNMVREEKTISGVLYTIQYGYNGNNALTSMTYPSGRVVTYVPDGTGRISGVNTTLNGIPKTLASSITYRPFGPVAGLTCGNGLALLQGYDSQYRVSSITLGSVLGLTYQYYPDGNVLSIADVLHPTESVLDTPGVYAYPTDSNRLTGITGTEPKAFGYDPNGNTTSENVRTFVYDLSNQLVEVRDNGNLTATYGFNGAGQRIKKVTQSGTRIFHYDLQGHLIAETDSLGATIVEYVYLGDQPLAMIRNETVSYYHNDHLGTPQVLTNDTGAVVWKALYGPFGTTQILTQTVESPLRFPGQYYDSETGLHYNYYRTYHPGLGRYVTPDPIGLAGGLNLYGYVHNNPLNFVDSEGLIDRQASSRLRRIWEDFHNRLWPKDPVTGWNQDVAHEKALADGGTNDVCNYGPKPRKDHVQEHVEKGDYKRWGARSKSQTGTKLGVIGGLMTVIDIVLAEKQAKEDDIDVWTQMLINIGLPVVVIHNDGRVEYHNGASRPVY